LALSDSCNLILLSQDFLGLCQERTIKKKKKKEKKRNREFHGVHQEFTSQLLEPKLVAFSLSLCSDVLAQIWGAC
jgi:hypothetical protein